MKKSIKTTLLCIAIFLFSFLNYIIYKKLLYPYLFQTVVREFINNPIFLISYLILTGNYFLFVILQLANRKIHKSFITFSIIVYLPILAFILFGKSVGVRGVDFNILNIFTNLKVSSLECFINVLIFIPIGILVKLLDWKRIIIYLVLIFSIEIIQYLFSLGIFDIADILFNFIGIFLGSQLRIFLKHRAVEII